MTTRVTYSDQYLSQIHLFESGDGQKRAIASKAREAIKEIIKNPEKEEYTRDYLTPIKKVVLGKVPPQVDELGEYCLFFEVITNVNTGVQKKTTNKIIHIVWINSHHHPHKLRVNHYDWSTDPCVCKFKELLNEELIDTFDKNRHFGVFSTNNNIGDNFFHVKLNMGPKTTEAEDSRESSAQVSVYFELGENNNYNSSDGIQISGKDRGQAYTLLHSLTDELISQNYSIEISLWSPMEDELQYHQSICRSLGYKEEHIDDVYVFAKSP